MFKCIHDIGTDDAPGLEPCISKQRFAERGLATSNPMVQQEVSIVRGAVKSHCSSIGRKYKASEDCDANMMS